MTTATEIKEFSDKATSELKTVIKSNSQYRAVAFSFLSELTKKWERKLDTGYAKAQYNTLYAFLEDAFQNGVHGKTYGNNYSNQQGQARHDIKQSFANFNAPQQFNGAYSCKTTDANPIKQEINVVKKNRSTQTKPKTKTSNKIPQTKKQTIADRPTNAINDVNNRFGFNGNCMKNQATVLLQKNKQLKLKEKTVRVETEKNNQDIRKLLKNAKANPVTTKNFPQEIKNLEKRVKKAEVKPPMKTGVYGSKNRL